MFETSQQPTRRDDQPCAERGRSSGWGDLQPAQSRARTLALAWRQRRRVVLAGLFLCATLEAGAAGTDARATNAPADFSAPVDAAFSRALPVIREQLGLRDTPPGLIVTNWQAHLCLLLGFRVDVGPKRSAYLIEITTEPMDPAAATNRSKLPPAAIMNMNCPANSLISTTRVYRFTSPRYPVRVRVYDENGAFLKESREYLPWSFLTNGLHRGCLARLTDTDAMASQKAGGASSGKVSVPTSAATRREAIERQLRRERTILGSLTALVTMFDDTLAASSLGEVRDHAFEVVRKPSLLRVIADLGLNLRLEPNFEAAMLLPPAPDESEPRAWLPVELKQGGRLLLSISFVTASTAGPHFLTGGIRAIRAVHPTKADRQLLAQVLAVGEVIRDVAPARSRRAR